MQETLVIILFIGAMAFLARTFLKSSKGEAGCGSNCGCEKQPIKPKF